MSGEPTFEMQLWRTALTAYLITGITVAVVCSWGVRHVRTK